MSLMQKTKLDPNKRSIWQKIHIDLPLLLGLLTLMGVGLFVIYSAGGQDWDLIKRQLIRLTLALGVMFVVAQIPPLAYR
ncbi:rod shape-determining protein RodA, partial [Bowmanella dokdonensis]|nr:rod shape-determining protein RodA [Bowmanella dokdonensis]